jgi:hypothetical protein
MPVAGGTAAKNSSTVHKGDPDLAPIHVSLGHLVTDLKPLVARPWFIGAQGLPLGLFFAGFFLGRRNRKISRDPAFLKKKQVRQKVGRSIREMDRAIAEHDVSLFFNACMSAARERLGELWSLPAETITLAEIKARLGEDAAGIRQVFQKADAAAYSGQSFSHGELERCRDLFLEELKNLDKTCAGRTRSGKGTGGLWK